MGEARANRAKEPERIDCPSCGRRLLSKEGDEYVFKKGHGKSCQYLVGVTLGWIKCPSCGLRVDIPVFQALPANPNPGPAATA